MHRFHIALAALLLTTAGCDLVGESGTQSESGELRSGDDTLDSGEYFDVYTVAVEVGDVVSADLSSEDFDPYLILESGDELQVDNDDCTPDDLTRSCAEITAVESGTVRVLVTSFEPGETGDYTLEIETDGGAARPARSGPGGRAKDPAQVAARR